MKTKRWLGIMMFFLAVTASAQETKQWTLEQCINYALEKNITLNKQKLALDETEENLKQTKAGLLPSLSFNSSHNVNYRPFQEGTTTVSGTEVYNNASKTAYNGSYSLGANWTIWNGGRNTASIRMQEKVRDMAQMSVAEQEALLKEEITKLYVQILYADEAVKINRSTLEVSQATYARAQELFKQGSISKVELAQLESQVGNDSYTLVTSESALRNYKRQLKQILEISEAEEMSIHIPTIDDARILTALPSQTSVYAAAAETRPEINSGKTNVEYAQLGIKSAKAGYLPTLSLSASIGTSTYSGSNYAWGNQMKNGLNNVVGLSVSVPIFDNRQNKTNVAKAKIAYNTSLLELQTKEKELYSNIETIWLDALNAQEQFKAAQTKLASSETSFDLVNQQFSLGMKNVVELLTEKNNLLQAQLQKTQSKYMALLNRTLLDFYVSQQIAL